MCDGALMGYMTPKPSISMSDDLYSDIKDRLGPGLSKFMRKAAKRSMYIEDRSAEFGGKLPDDWWKHACDEYLERHSLPEKREEIEAD